MLSLFYQSARALRNQAIISEQATARLHVFGEARLLKHQPTCRNQPTCRGTPINMAPLSGTSSLCRHDMSALSDANIIGGRHFAQARVCGFAHIKCWLYHYRAFENDEAVDCVTAAKKQSIRGCLCTQSGKMKYFTKRPVPGYYVFEIIMKASTER